MRRLARRVAIQNPKFSFAEFNKLSNSIETKFAKSKFN